MLACVYVTFRAPLVTSLPHTRTCDMFSNPIDETRWRSDPFKMRHVWHAHTARLRSIIIINTHTRHTHAHTGRPASDQTQMYICMHTNIYNVTRYTLHTHLYALSVCVLWARRKNVWYSNGETPKRAPHVMWFVLIGSNRRSASWWRRRAVASTIT